MSVKNSFLFLALLGSLVLTSCEVEEVFEEQNDFPTANDDDDDNTSTIELNLPETPFNYSNPNLPPFFNGPGVMDQDNTPNDNPLTDWGATLGRVLFYDVALSANNTISCASCHKQEAGFSDDATFSTGFEGGLTGRNSMGLTNAKFYENGHFFWDERASTLEDQVLMPIQDHIEMGLTLDELEVKVRNLEYYEDLFINAFGDSEVSSDRIALALAQFVRSMISYESKYDEGFAGLPRGQNPNQTDFTNFTDLENLGKELFFSNRTNCATCHGSINFVGPEARNNGLDLVSEDLGVGGVTGNQNEIGLFKVNSLRNVELTAPYMHDGRFETLAEVIEHYNSGVQAHPNLAPQLRVGGPGQGGPDRGQPRRLNLTDEEKQALVAFLLTLTDENFIADEKFSDPFEN